MKSASFSHRLGAAALAAVLCCTAVALQPTANRASVALADEAQTLQPAGDLPSNHSFEEEEADGLTGFDDALANSLTGFGDTQGASGWRYGYIRAEDRPADNDALAVFRPLERNEAGWWRHEDSPVPAISATTFEGSPGLIPVRRWTPRAKGSVRLVGYVQKPSGETEAEFHVLANGSEIWSRHLAREDSIRHAFDILALDLSDTSTVDFLMVAGPDSPRVQVNAMFQIVPEPHASRWRADLPTGFPEITEAERQTQREKGQEVLQRIREASESGRGRVVIPPGDYRFHANWSRESTLSNLADLEIDARGTTFWFEPPHVHALLFENCHNVTLRGLEIDFTSPIWFQARVTDIDRPNETVRAVLIEGYAPRDANGKEENSGERTFVFYDADGHFINHRHSPGKWRLSEDGRGVLCEEIRRHGIPDVLRIGDYLVATIRTGAALRSVNCSGMHFEDVNIWSSPGMAVYESGGEGGNIYRRVRATRHPYTNRLHAFGADAFHMAATDRGPVLDRCESAYSADDNINIHGRFGRIVHRADDRCYHMEGAYEVGDTLEFRDQTSVELLGTAKVVSVEKTPDGPSLAINEKYRAKGEFLVELAQPLVLPELCLVVMDGKRSASGFVIRNCWFHSNFQRTLINGAPGGLIENTTLQNVGMGICIQFETWGPWMEGPFARDLVIRNNRFLNSPPDGPVVSVSMHPPGGGTNTRPREARPVTNLTISGNYLARTAGMPFDVHNVDGLKIHGNSVDRLPSAPATPSDLLERHLLRRDGGRSANPEDLNWLYLQDCSNVSIRQNHTPGTSQTEEDTKRQIQTLEVAANLLPNPSFEEREAQGAQGWTSRAWAGKDDARWSVESPGRTGRHCVSISSAKGADVAWTTTVPVKPNAWYRLSGWIKTKEVRGAVGALLNIQNMQAVKTPAVSGNRDWTRVSTVFQAEVTELEINCLYGGWGMSTGQAWYDDLALEPVDNPPSETQATVTIDTDARSKPYSPMIFGGFLEHFGRQVYGGVFDPGSPLSDKDGFRLDVVAALKELKSPVVRWPGGCYVSGYHWERGVKNSRKPTDDMAWGVIEPNTFGTDEFVKLCRLIGWQPYICNNAGNGTVEEMRNWVEYCNGRTGKYAQMRKDNGHPDPQDVNIWSIGNENWGRHEIGYKPIEQWAPFVLEAAKAMKAVDPQIQLSAAAMPSREWTLPLLEMAGPYLDYISIHAYWLPLWQENDMPDYLTCIMSSERPEETIARFVGVLDESGYRGRIKIAFDEWNLRSWHHPGFPRKTVQDYSDPEVANLVKAREKNDIASQYTMADALFSASFFNACLRHAEDVGMANIAPIVNTRGPLHVHPEGIVRRTHFHAMAMYANELEARVGKHELLTGNLRHGKVSVPVIDAIATVDESGKQWAIALVNRHPSENVACTVKMGDRLLDGKYKATLLNGESPDSYNDIENPNRVVPEKMELTFKKGTASLPPHSLTIVHVPASALSGLNVGVE